MCVSKETAADNAGSKTLQKRCAASYLTHLLHCNEDLFAPTKGSVKRCTDQTLGRYARQSEGVSTLSYRGQCG